jgi:hypothetical protein
MLLVETTPIILRIWTYGIFPVQAVASKFRKPTKPRVWIVAAWIAEIPALPLRPGYSLKYFRDYRF